MKHTAVFSLAALGCVAFPSFSMAQQQAAAEPPRYTPDTVPGVVSYSEHTDADGKVIIHRSIEAASLDEPGKKVVIGQVLEKLKDGRLLFVAGQQPKEANAYRQKICQRSGGNDVTNQGHVVIGSDTIDAIICMRKNNLSAASDDVTP